MNIYKKILNTTTTVLLGATVIGGVSFASADPLSDAAQAENVRQGVGSIDVIETFEMAGSACDEWIEARGWTVGNNQKQDGTRFHVSNGSGTIQAKPGHPNYIDSRQNAYEKAVLNAKATLIKYMNSAIETELTLAVKEGTFSSTPIQTSKNTTEQQAEPDANGWETAYAKTMRLLHAELNNQLDSRGVDPNPEPTEEEKMAAEQATREILNSEEFRQLIASTSKAQLKGVRRMFVNETVVPNERGSICVVMLGSPKTMAMADAIMTGNSDIAPTGYFGKPLSEQIPDKNVQAGIRELLNSYGVQMSRDEAGEFHLIAYAQAGARSKTKLSQSSAKKQATLRAQAALAAFAGEHAAVTARSENSETAKEFADSMSEIDYESNRAMEEVISSATPMINLSGGRVRSSWGALHPVTNQIIIGVIYQWSAGSAVAAKELKREINQTARPRNVAKPAGSLNTRKGLQGSASRGSSESDF